MLCVSVQIAVRNRHFGFFLQEDFVPSPWNDTASPKLRTENIEVSVDEFNLEHLLTRHGEQDVCTLSTADHQRCLAVPLFDDL